MEFRIIGDRTSPVAILLNTDWAGFSWMQLLIGVITFGLGWFAASKLGGD